jgi:UDP-N-acetylglucosamine 2-epimerase (non-hydrolysing)
MAKTTKLKVLTVVGTRPEIIRLSRVISKLDTSDSIHHILVHTGQNYDYELNQIFFDDLEIRKPDHFLNVDTTSLGKAVGDIIKKSEDILIREKPGALLILGDTNSCLAAYMAKRMHIPIFHMEAGNRCFDQRVPEETNRKIVDHISDINLTYSDIAREYLLREGFPPDRVIKTGSPMFEVLNYYMPKIKKSQIVSELKLKQYNYFLISSHREENINNNKSFRKFIDVLNSIAEKYRLPVIVSAHPRTMKMIEKKKVKLKKLVKLEKPFGFNDYISLQLNAFAVLSDSGTISEEASILNLPALNIREAHERPEAMEEASVILTGYNKERIFQALEQMKSQNRNNRHFRLVADYSMPNVSDKVVRLILSHIDYVKRNVWKETGF